MKVICINVGGFKGLTLDKDYDIIEEADGGISIINDKNIRANYALRYFRKEEEIIPEPEPIIPIEDKLQITRLGANDIQIRYINDNLSFAILNASKICGNCGFTGINGLNDLYCSCLSYFEHLEDKDAKEKAIDLFQKLIVKILDYYESKKDDAMIIFSTNSE